MRETKKLRAIVTWAALAVLLMGGFTHTAEAAITVEKDSGTFNYKYEFDGDYAAASPDSIDIDANGYNDMGLYNAGAAIPVFSDGKMTITTTGGEEIAYCVADGLSPDPNNEIWRAVGFNASEGFTIELSAKVLAQTEGKGFATCIGAVAGDPDNLVADDTDGVLFIGASGQSWLSSQALGTVFYNNTDDYHIFRIALDPANQTFSVWRDRALIGQGLGDIIPGVDGLNRFYIGDLFSPIGGSVSYEYLRFMKGAYAPVDAYTPPQPGDITEKKNSANFTYKYEFNGNYEDSAPDRVDLDNNSVADMSLYQDGGTAPVVQNGSLTITSTGGAEIGYCTADGLSADPGNELWRNVGFDCENGFTIEFAAKVLAQQEQLNAAMGVFATAADPNNVIPDDVDGWFRIATNGQLWGYDLNLGEEGWTYDNTDRFHVFRLALNPSNQKFWVWRDGRLIGKNIGDGDLFLGLDGLNRFIFGDLMGADEGSVEFDYIRLMQGAFAPDEAMTLFPGDANFSGTVDEADAAILAQNWLKSSEATWADGDFNGDGKVDDADATILAANWLKSNTTGSASVPEPASFAMLACLLLAAAIFAKRLK